MLMTNVSHGDTLWFCRKLAAWYYWSLDVHYSPQLVETFRSKKRRPAGRWRFDKTYIKVKVCGSITPEQQTTAAKPSSFYSLRSVIQKLRCGIWERRSVTGRCSSWPAIPRFAMSVLQCSAQMDSTTGWASKRKQEISKLPKPDITKMRLQCTRSQYRLAIPSRNTWRHKCRYSSHRRFH